MREWLITNIAKYDIRRLITQDQNYFNQFPKNKLEYIDLQIKIFHRILLKRGLELFDLEKNLQQESSVIKGKEAKEQEKDEENDENDENEEGKEEQEEKDEQVENLKEQIDDEDYLAEEKDVVEHF